MAPIIEAHGLVKHYKAIVALDGLDLAVEPGTILSVLGPNGARPMPLCVKEKSLCLVGRLEEYPWRDGLIGRMVVVGSGK